MVEDDPRFEVIAAASTMVSVWKNVLDERPEVALLDWCTASQDLELTRALLRSGRHATSFIFLTVSDDSRQRESMLRLGARTFVSKWCSAEDLRAAVVNACKDGPSQPPLRPTASAVSNADLRIRQLTKRERQLVPMVCSGLKNKEIASRLGIAESTVWHHLTSVFTKLQVDDRMGLAAFAYSHGLALPNGGGTSVTA
jgi:DNA-binding NarL/FixJ family response regulator